MKPRVILPTELGEVQYFDAPEPTERTCGRCERCVRGSSTFNLWEAVDPALNETHGICVVDGYVPWPVRLDEKDDRRRPCSGEDWCPRGGDQP